VIDRARTTLGWTSSSSIPYTPRRVSVSSCMTAILDMVLARPRKGWM